MSPVHHAVSGDPILTTLSKAQIHFATFRHLTGVDDVRELTFNRIRKTRDRIAQEDQIAQSKKNGRDITCLPWTVGAFWLLPEGVNEYFRSVHLFRANQGGIAAQPLGQLTLREVVNQHLGNLRQLVLSLAYDWIVVETLSGKLMSRDHVTLSKEITRCEQTVQDLIQNLLLERESLRKLLGVKIEMYERACITERMLQMGTMDEATLGHTLANLKRAQRRALELCRQELDIFEQLLKATRVKVQKELRGGEQTQLARMNRLDYAFHRVGEPPDGFAGLASLVAFERRRLAGIVVAREKELGSSNEGEALLAQSQALDRAEEAACAKAKVSKGRILRPTKPEKS